MTRLRKRYSRQVLPSKPDRSSSLQFSFKELLSAFPLLLIIIYVFGYIILYNHLNVYGIYPPPSDILAFIKAGSTYLLFITPIIVIAYYFIIVKRSPYFKAIFSTVIATCLFLFYFILIFISTFDNTLWVVILGFLSLMIAASFMNSFKRKKMDIGLVIAAVLFLSQPMLFGEKAYGLINFDLGGGHPVKKALFLKKGEFRHLQVLGLMDTLNLTKKLIIPYETTSEYYVVLNDTSSVSIKKEDVISEVALTNQKFVEW